MLQGIVKSEILPFYKIYFAKNDSDTMYRFFESDEDDFDEEFEDVDFEDIIGYDWQEALSHTHYNNNNVQNWDELVRFFEKQMKK
jgi:hypothetical protein